MSKRNPFIFVIEPDAEVLESIRRSFYSMRGKWDVQYFPAAMDALVAFKDRQADIVLSAMEIPDCHGIQLVRDMMVEDVLGITRYIFLTGPADYDSALTAISELEVYKFVEKTATRDTLFEAIRETLREIQKEKLIGGHRTAVSLENAPIGVWVLSKTAEVQYANPEGRNILEKSASLTLEKQNVCTATNVTDSGRLRDVMMQTIEDPSDRVHVIEIKNKLTARLDKFILVPQGAGDESRTIVMMSAPERIGASSTHDAIQKKFGFSSQEAMIVMGLVKGQSLRQAAGYVNIDISSAREFLKTAMTKTQATTLVGLIRTVNLAAFNLLK